MAALDTVGQGLNAGQLAENGPIIEELLGVFRADANKIAWALFDEFKGQMKIKKLIFNIDFSHLVENFVIKLVGARTV